eukprot:13936.XXX_480485_480643_1 [CDS] Oithona nana genome sequencing.
MSIFWLLLNISLDALSILLQYEVPVVHRDWDPRANFLFLSIYIEHFLLVTNH